MQEHTLQVLKALFDAMCKKIDAIAIEQVPSDLRVPIAELLGLCTQINKILDGHAALPAAPGDSLAAAVSPQPGPSESPASKPPPAPAAKPIPGRCVLLIDDDPDIHKVLSFLLTRKGQFTVHSETNPVKALERLVADGFSPKPGIILMDLMMPQMTGFDLLKRIRSHPQLSFIKIMIGSSRSYDKDRISILQAGANDFIAKPYNFEELLLRLANLVV